MSLPAYSRSLDALSRRARSSRELSRWLADRGYAQADIAEAIERLTASGLLDDAKYAYAFARTRLVDRHQSPRRVSAELARRGVPRDVADQAIAAVTADSDVDAEAAIEAAARKRLRALSVRDPVVRRRRLMAFLLRQGFDLARVRDVVGRVLDG